MKTTKYIVVFDKCTENKQVFDEFETIDFPEQHDTYEEAVKYRRDILQNEQETVWTTDEGDHPIEMVTVESVEDLGRLEKLHLVLGKLSEAQGVLSEFSGDNIDRSSLALTEARYDLVQLIERHRG